MKMKNLAILSCCAVVALFAAGCDGMDIIESSLEQIQDTPTPAAAASPTPAPTMTPTITPTPGPRVIGVKTDSAMSLIVTNNCRSKISDIYVCTADTGDWGRNLLPSESLLKEAEEAQMYYTPSATGLYDVQVVIIGGSAYEFYSVNLADISSMSINLDSESDLTLTYTSNTDGSAQTIYGTQTVYGYDLTDGSDLDSDEDSEEDMDEENGETDSEDGMDVTIEDEEVYATDSYGNTYTYRQYLGLDP